MSTTVPPRQELQRYLDFARELAREAGKLTLGHFRTELEVELKSDESPVTIADRETEKLLVRRILDQFPQHGILGEEFGQVNPEASWRWILDPIDGTQAFIHGVPLYTVLIALTWEQEPYLGVIHNPPQDETVAAATGLGCFYNGRPCRVSRRERLADARVHTTDWANLAHHRPEFSRRLLGETKFARSWADGYGYLMVATGRADVMVDPVLSLWDVAPLYTVITEAGGRFTDFDGNGSIHSGHGIASNDVLHEQLLALARCDGA